MNEENQVYFVDSDQLPPAALERKHRLEQDPSFRTNHMEYMKGMQIIGSDIKEKVLKAMDAYDYDVYTAADVERALSNESCSIEDFKALLSPAAAPYLEQMARKAEEITKNHFGNTVYIFTPLYIANYCQNYCIYCGFNCYNNIRRKKLSFEEIEHEMQVIADSGIGIRPEDLPRVFEKGFTGYNGREDKKSTGIGLYLCRRVMDRLNHGISIVSRPGQGTLVRLDLSRGRRVVE